LTFNHNALLILGALWQSDRPPEVRELVLAMGSPNPQAAFGHLKRLRRAGLVSWERMKARTIVAKCKFIRAQDLGSS